MGKVASVSSLGRFRSTRGVVSTPKPMRSGYVSVKINKNKYLVHRLSAFAFQLPRKEGQTYVNHIDGNPTNNKKENLEWCSHAENINHSYKTNKTRASNAPRQSKPVLARRVGDGEWKSFPSQSEAARQLELRVGLISACLQKKRTQTGGYEFAKGDPTEPPLLEGEEWRDCRQGGKVSSLGRFESTYGVITTPKPRQDGYCCVRIASKSYRVHRLVADAFLPPPPTPKHKYVNHKDGNPSNNHVSNLEWCTHSENIAHSYATNLNRESSAGRMAKPVRGRPVQGGEWTIYPGGANEAGRALGIHNGNISAVCNEKHITVQGYVFEFDEPTEVDVLEGEEWRDVTDEILGSVTDKTPKMTSHVCL